MVYRESRDARIAQLTALIADEQALRGQLGRTRRAHDESLAQAPIDEPLEKSALWRELASATRWLGQISTALTTERRAIVRRRDELLAHQREAIELA